MGICHDKSSVVTFSVVTLMSSLRMLEVTVLTSERPPKRRTRRSGIEGGVNDVTHMRTKVRVVQKHDSEPGSVGVCFVN